MEGHQFPVTGKQQILAPSARSRGDLQLTSQLFLRLHSGQLGPLWSALKNQITARLISSQEIIATQLHKSVR